MFEIYDYGKVAQTAANIQGTRGRNALNAWNLQQSQQQAEEVNKLRELAKMHAGPGGLDHEAFARALEQQGYPFKAQEVHKAQRANALGGLNDDLTRLQWLQKASAGVHDQASLDAYRQKAQQFGINIPVPETWSKQTKRTLDTIAGRAGTMLEGFQQIPGAPPGTRGQLDPSTGKWVNIINPKSGSTRDNANRIRLADGSVRTHADLRSEYNAMFPSPDGKTIESLSLMEGGTEKAAALLERWEKRPSYEEWLRSKVSGGVEFNAGGGPPPGIPEGAVEREGQWHVPDPNSPSGWSMLVPDEQDVPDVGNAPSPEVAAPQPTVAPPPNPYAAVASEVGRAPHEKVADAIKRVGIKRAPSVVAGQLSTPEIQSALDDVSREIEGSPAMSGALIQIRVILQEALTLRNKKNLAAENSSNRLVQQFTSGPPGAIPPAKIQE